MSGQLKFEYILQAKYKGEGELGRMRRDLDALGKVESIKKLGKEVRELTVKFNDAQKKLEQQAREMRDADVVTKEMTKSYEASRRSVERLAASLNKKKQAFKGSTSAARTAGVDTRKLVSEEKRLAKASEETGKVWAARRVLGVRAHRDIREEVKKLRLAYDVMKKSGKASALELFQAKHNLKKKTAELVGSTNGWAASLEKVRIGAVALAGVGYGLVRVFQEFSGFESGMAEVHTLLDISTDRFVAFKDETRDIIGTLPQQSADLTKSLYDIISAGVELDASGKVLELSAKAATAGITETKTAVNIGVGAMNAYGKEVDSLEGYYDILFQTVKSGVTTFPELAQNMGDVLPGARAAGVEFHEVGAAIAALTKAGIKTPKAATALTGAIRAMAAPAPAAKKQFDELGITWEGLLPTLEQIAEKGLSIDQMRMLIPDVEASTGVLSLTQNLEEFKSILSSMDEAGGSMKTAYNIMADTPEYEVKEMVKALQQAGITLGHLASFIILPAANAVEFFTSKINESNWVVKGFFSMIGAGVATVAIWHLGLGAVSKTIFGMGLNLASTTAKFFGFTSATAAARAGVQALTATMLANPITAVTIGLILAGSAAWALFGKDSLEASRKHAAAAKKLGEGRVEIEGQIKALERLRKTVQRAEPDSEEYLKAQRDLAKVLPDANLALDEQGRLIANMGDGIGDNTEKLDKYIDLLQEEQRMNLALQLEQQAKSFREADQSFSDYKKNMADEYAIGGDGILSSGLWRELDKLTGIYDKNVQKGREVYANLQKQKGAYNELLQAMAKMGLSADDVGVALDEMHIDSGLRAEILAAYDRFSQALEGVADSAEDSGNKQKNTLTSSIKDIEREYVQLAEKVKGIYNEIAQREQSLGAEIRAERRKNMSDGSAWKDLKAEAEEYYQAAQNAASGGDFEEAKRLADVAKGKYRELNTEVKDGKRVLVSRAKAEQTATEGMQRAGELAIEVLKESAAAHEKHADELVKMAGEFSGEWQSAWDDFLSDGTKAISDLENRLNALTKPRNIPVSVSQTESHAVGGMIGVIKRQLGGLIEPQRLQVGGSVGFMNLLAGGRLPGFGGGDRRWILGEDGEVMIRKESVRAAGARASLAFNAGNWSVVVSELVSRFGLNVGDILMRQFGGFIGAAGANVAQPVVAGTGGSSFSPTIEVHVTSGADRAVADNIAKTVLRQLETMWRRQS